MKTPVFEIGNRFTVIRNPNKKLIRLVTKLSSYRVAGYMFSPSFKAHRWDGKEHLLRFSTKTGYRFPTGLMVSIYEELKASGLRFKIANRATTRHKRRRIEYTGPPPRGYQKRAVKRLLAKPFRCRGILKMPVRSGKTLTASYLISKVGLPTIFVVPSKQLLWQSYKELSNMLGGQTIGIVGDGVYDPQFITVASVQTLLKLMGRKKDRDKPAIPRSPRFDKLVKRFDLMITDELHRVKGQGSWHEAVYEFEARYKIGLSATVFLDRKEEQERGAIWMQAICGSIKYEVSTSYLVKKGFLMRQNVEMYKIKKPDWRGSGWSQRMRRACISSNRYRNRKIATIAREKSEQGFKVLIIARFREHIGLIQEACEDQGLTTSVVVGSSSMSRRNQAAEDLVDGTVDVVIANVFGEGVDIKEVDCVIVAEGGKDAKQTIQRQRNLTIAKGKKKAILIDFLDLTNERLEDHSRERLAVYKSEKSFRVKIV